MYKKEIPWTFKNWLANFIDVDLPIGDLARDSKTFKDFPAIDDYELIYNFIYSKGRSIEVMECFDEVWKFYQATR